MLINIQLYECSQVEYAQINKLRNRVSPLPQKFSHALFQSPATQEELPFRFLAA